MFAQSDCRHCDRAIILVDGAWIDPRATGDDEMWRETCDAHDTFTAEHEPDHEQLYDCPHGCPLVIYMEDAAMHQEWHRTSR